MLLLFSVISGSGEKDLRNIVLESASVLFAGPARGQAGVQAEGGGDRIWRKRGGSGGVNSERADNGRTVLRGGENKNVRAEDNDRRKQARFRGRFLHSHRARELAQGPQEPKLNSTAHSTRTNGRQSPDSGL